ncbi:MAG: pilus assembly protein N-terminal domain-containing protein [Pseudomonadota bacterium]
MRALLRMCVASTAVVAATLATSLFAPTEASANEMVLVELDLAKIVTLTEPAATIVLGNPAIADASIFDAERIVITGKSYGTTNLIALGPDGEELYNTLVTVRAPEQTLITVHRGGARSSYSCAPTCQPSLVVGDATENFDSVNSQVSARTENAVAGATE